MEKKILIHAWSLQRKGEEYYIPFTHWIYLKEIIKYYDKIVLLSPVKKLKESQEPKGSSISSFKNVSVFPLPYNDGGYIGALKYFFHYRKAYKVLDNISVYYARYPVPFGWLQKIYGRNRKRIIHYVGDPVDAAKNNPNFSYLKKIFLINGFKPENILYNWAGKDATVYANGYHLANKLNRFNLRAIPLISSTLSKNDFYYDESKDLSNTIKFIYIGYLRKAKGVETVLRAFSIFHNQNPNSKLTIVGTGESDSNLKNICKIENISNVIFTGHIDDRAKLNETLREHDIFLFASLSEGSPRVILEAMANGLLVISTPVGSLPKTFEDKKEILFADFNDKDDFAKKILMAIKSESYFNYVRFNGFQKARTYTLEDFIKKIFHET